jgi:serine/threonine protein phosphatase PrpC
MTASQPPASGPQPGPTDPACPACGEPVAPSGGSCESCGADLAPVVVSDGTHGPADGEARSCPACGAGAASPGGFCAACGQRLPAGRDHEELDLGLVAAASDRGIRHERNEDAVALATAETADGPAVIAVVSDGVSTADQPDQASLATVRAAVRELLAAARAGTDLAEASVRAAGEARDAVVALTGPSGDPLAATFVSAVMAGGTITVCWLGDSRAYWLDAGPRASGRQLTKDDSLADEMVARGLLDESEALTAPEAHVVTRWIGADTDASTAHVSRFTPPGRGVLMLCSDGLWNYEPDAGKLAKLALPGALTDPPAAARGLVAFALEAGGMDNITVALAPYPPARPARAPAPPAPA